LFVFFPAVTILSCFSYYDQSVLDFLQEFNQNPLLTNVHLLLYGENRRKFDAMSQMMTQFMPSITSIESLNPYNCYNNNTGLFREEHADMMSSTRIIFGWSSFIFVLS
jgi:hypothetical protein